MKQLLGILLSLFSMTAIAQTDALYGKGFLTGSEKKASLIISKVRETVTISDSQAIQLVTLTADYWDDLQEIKKYRKFAERSAEYTENLKKDELKVLKDQAVYEAYKKKMDEIIRAQRAGYGRRR